MSLFQSLTVQNPSINSLQLQLQVLMKSYLLNFKGNDITSSCLYVAGICVLYAKLYAPISLVLVCFVLYLFRNIYAEVVTALPLNGGCYNVLLNR
jgi:hypothetical protein